MGGNHEEFDYVFIPTNPQSTARFSASPEIASFIFNEFWGVYLL